MKMKNFLQKRIFAAFALIALVIAGCGGTETGTPGTGTSSTPAAKVTITYLTHWSGPQVDQLNQAAAAFNKIDPNITVKVQPVPFGNLLTTMTTQGGSSSGPTIMGIYNLWMPQLVQDSLLDPVPDAQVDGIKSAYPQGVVSAVQVDGKTYGYPNEVDLYALNYNKALFEEAGLKEPPKTWAELMDYSKKLTKRDDSGKVTQQGFGIITSWNSGVVHPWLSLVNSNGGQLLSPEHKPLLDSKAATEAADLYNQMIFQEKTTDPAMGQANASTTGPFLDNFANGKTAMIIMANWWEGNLKSSMGDNFKNIATAPIPVGPSGDKSHSVSYSWSTVVNANATTEQKAAAWKFLQWLNGPESGLNGSSSMGDILMGMGILPGRDSDLKAHQEKLSSPFISTYVNELPNSIPFPTVLGGDELTTSLQKSLESMEFGQASPQQAMSQAQANLSQILSQYYS